MILNSTFLYLERIKLLILVVVLNASCSDIEDIRVVSGFTLLQDDYTTYVILPEDACDIPSLNDYTELTDFISSQDGYISDKDASEFIAEKALVLISCRPKKNQYKYYVVEKESILASGSGDGSKIKEVRKSFFD